MPRIRSKSTPVAPVAPVANAEPVTVAPVANAEPVAKLNAPADAGLSRVELAVALAQAFSASKDLGGEVSAQTMLASRRLSAHFIAAYLDKSGHFALQGEMMGRFPADWKRCKDIFSKAVTLCDVVTNASAALPVIHLSKSRKATTIGGREIAELSRDMLPMLADPMLDDSPISTLFQRIIAPYQQGITLINGLPVDGNGKILGPSAPQAAELPDATGPAELVKMDENTFAAMLRERLADPEYRAEVMAQCQALNDARVEAGALLAEALAKSA